MARWPGSASPGSRSWRRTGRYTTAEASQFDGFDAIKVYDQPGYEQSRLNLIIAGPGTADLSGELGQHDVNIQLLVGGNSLTLGGGE